MNLTMQPHDGIHLPHKEPRPALYFAALFLIVGLAFSMTTPDEWQSRVKSGLKKVALGQVKNSYLSQANATVLLRDWFNIQVKCEPATEQMWMSFCQNLYYERMSIDCNNPNKQAKAEIMRNLGKCYVVG
jgi:hypothetical protein